MGQLTKPWEFNVLNIYDYRKAGPYSYMFNFLQLNQKFMRGDIFEAGTFNGRTALAFALFLKEQSLPGIIRTFDSFEGFPSYSTFDNFDRFFDLFNQNKISDRHYAEIKKMATYTQEVLKKSLHPSQISTSKDFRNVDLELIKRKQNFLGLDNLVLYKGDFAITLKIKELQDLHFSLAFIDCDLYKGYIDSLNYVWPKLLPNGIIFLDEYYSLKFPGPRLAVQEFLQQLNIDSFQLRMISNPEDDFERWIIEKV